MAKAHKLGHFLWDLLLWLTDPKGAAAWMSAIGASILAWISWLLNYMAGFLLWLALSICITWLSALSTRWVRVRRKSASEAKFWMRARYGDLCIEAQNMLAFPVIPSQVDDWTRRALPLVSRDTSAEFLRQGISESPSAILTRRLAILTGEMQRRS